MSWTFFTSVYFCLRIVRASEIQYSIAFNTHWRREINTKCVILMQQRGALYTLIVQTPTIGFWSSTIATKMLSSAIVFWTTYEFGAFHVAGSRRPPTYTLSLTSSGSARSQKFTCKPSTRLPHNRDLHINFINCGERGREKEPARIKNVIHFGNR